MKVLILTGLAIAIAPAARAAQSDKQTWVHITTSTSGEEYSIRQRDLDSAQPAEKRVAWVLWKGMPDLMKARTLLRYDVNCVDRTLVTDHRAFYGKNGQISRSYDTPWIKRGPALPGTIAEAITDKVCG